MGPIHALSSAPVLTARWVLVAFALAALAGSVALLAGGPPGALAHGRNSPAACSAGGVIEVDPHDTGGSAGFSFTFNAPEGQIVAGVCLASGSNMFGGAGHSGVLGNGTFEDGCYAIDGVGTSTVTVRRELSGPGCQGISHLDVIVSAPSPTPTATAVPPTPTPTPTPTGQTLTATPTLAAATPTPTAPGAVAGVASPPSAVAGVRALPATGGASADGDGNVALLLLAALGALAAGGGLVVLAGRLRA